MGELKNQHPLGTNAKILLSSVFGPFAQDDEYGSRLTNPMELCHNQVTRLDGGFSFRVFNRSGGLMMVQDNIDAPCTLLDYPTLDQFVKEIQTKHYDVVGISAVIMNYAKVEKMCELIRKYLPNAEIVVGGHIANLPNIEKRIDADHIVRGDGISWFRRYLGQKEDSPIRHTLVYTSQGARVLGVNLPRMPGNTLATLYPSAGCPVGCNFCSTSALFGGKGNCIEFLKTGDEIFSVLSQAEEKMNAREFFVLDENFLLNTKKVLRLLELIEDYNKSWSFYVFSSARTVKSYTIEQLLSLGVSWIWMGLEGKESSYSKLNKIDTRELVLTLQSNGIRVLGSTIIGLENHSPENIDDVIDWAVSHGTDFHQFMLFTPLPGTPLYFEYQNQGIILPEEVIPFAEYHGQYLLNFRHKHIRDNMENEYILSAFQKDRDVNGPAIARMTKTMLQGYKKYKNHPEKRIRKRIRWENKNLKNLYAGMVWAAARLYGDRGNEVVRDKMLSILNGLYDEFGLYTKIVAPIIGRVFLFTIKREEKKMARGWTYEPKMIRERNQKAFELEEKGLPKFLGIKKANCRWVNVR